MIWSELAITQHQHWQSYTTALHKEDTLTLSRDPKTGVLTQLSTSLLQVMNLLPLSSKPTELTC